MAYQHELVLPNEDLPFKIFLFEGKNGNYVREKHWHRSIEIFAVLEGTLHFFLNDTRRTLHSGEFVIVNTNEIHSIFAPVENTTIVIQIPLKFFEHYYVKENIIWFSHENTAYDSQVVAYIRKMYKIYEEKSLGYELQLQSIFYQLIYIWITEYRWNEIEPEVIKANRKLERLGYITAHIRENYREDLSLEGLAKTFGYSPTYLSKMFRRYAQMNYKDYIQNVRLEYACQELEHTDNSIAEIAVNNGFANGKAMAKAFRKKYGQLPSQVKRQKAKEKE